MPRPASPADYTTVRITRELWDRLAAAAEQIRPKTSGAGLVETVLENWLERGDADPAVAWRQGFDAGRDGGIAPSNPYHRPRKLT